MPGFIFYIISCSMNRRLLYTLMIVLFFLQGLLAQDEDSVDNARLAQMISLSEVTINTGINVPMFIKRVKEDTTFYKAFRNLHIIGFTSWNDVRMKDKKGKIVASLQSKTKQVRKNGCRSMQVLDQYTTGDFFDNDGDNNYETGELYATLFFTKETICGENNVVKGKSFTPRSSGGMQKHKEQLKMLFFNPGKKIPGIPFIGDKIDIFDPGRAEKYDFQIDFGDYNGEHCYIFSIKAKQDLRGGQKNSIVIDSMVTWFNSATMEVVARNYDMSYDAGVYDFDVHMEAQMTRFGKYLVPKVLRYIGNWDVAFKKRERGMFTATLFDFTN